MLSFRSHRLCFFDSETGGLNPVDHDMVELAAIVTDCTGKEILAKYAQKVIPKKPVHPKAAAVNGYDPKVWAKEAIPIEKAMERISYLSRQAVFVAHNAPFDWDFLTDALKANGFKWCGSYHRIDTVALATPLLHHGLVENLKLATLTRELGIKHEDTHTAYGDVKALRGLYVMLMSLYASVPKTFKKMLAERAAKELHKGENEAGNDSKGE